MSNYPITVFDAPLVAEIHTTDDGFHATVYKDFYRITSEYGIVVVPRGFNTDFASIPRILWNILPPVGRYTDAAVVHDFLYSRGIDLCDGATRKRADLCFLELMERNGVYATEGNAMYLAVRFFGWHAWNEHAKTRSQQCKFTGPNSS